MSSNFTITGLYFPSFYVQEFDKAVSFYSEVFGTPETNLERLKGWKLGNTWLTLFPSDEGTAAGKNPRNAEFAVQVAAPE